MFVPTHDLRAGWYSSSPQYISSIEPKSMCLNRIRLPICHLPANVALALLLLILALGCASPALGSSLHPIPVAVGFVPPCSDSAWRSEDVRRWLAPAVRRAETYVT